MKPSKKVKPPIKEMRILGEFARGKRIHRFTAEQLLDHTLPSTISALQKKKGIYFQRQLVKVPSGLGGVTHVMEYWLEGKDLERARRLVGVV